MGIIKNLCVFCGSSSEVDPIYKETARKIGIFCAQKKWRLVYGGAHVGLMGIMADAALAGGGQVTGVIPQSLVDREVAHTGLSELHITGTMHERQQRMADLSDGFAVLPGGLGTLAEFFEVLTWKQLGLHNKPIVVVNINGYWDGLLQSIAEAEKAGFLHLQDRDLFTVTRDIQTWAENL